MVRIWDIFEVKIRHIEHKNPAAMADAFCDDPNIFAGINKVKSRGS
jgi:hypothetical protein